MHIVTNELYMHEINIISYVTFVFYFHGFKVQHRGEKVALFSIAVYVHDLAIPFKQNCRIVKSRQPCWFLMTR